LGCVPGGGGDGLDNAIAPRTVRGVAEYGRDRSYCAAVTAVNPWHHA